MSGYHQHRDLDLSPREREVLDLMAKGLTNGQIAESLDIAFDTAKSHVSAIIGKLGVETREEAVRAWRHHNRPDARFERLARGLAAGVGMWKVAAGATGVAVIGVGVAAGVVFAQSIGDDTRLPADQTAPTATRISVTPTVDPADSRDETTLNTMQASGRSTELGVLIDTHTFQYYRRDDFGPLITIGPEFDYSATPVMFMMMPSGCAGPGFGAVQHRDAVWYSVRVGDGVAIPWLFQDFPETFPPDWKFWSAPLEDAEGRSVTFTFMDDKRQVIDQRTYRAPRYSGPPLNCPYYDESYTHPTSAVTQTEMVEVASVLSDGREISLGLERWGINLRHTLRDSQRPSTPGTIESGLALLNDALEIGPTGNAFGVAWGSAQADIDAVELRFDDGTSEVVATIAAPDEVGTALRFWLVSLQGRGKVTEALPVEQQ